MNKPYVKQTDVNGIILNPIDKFYENPFPNRSARKLALKKEVFYGNSKNFHLTVIGISKFRRLKQHELDKEGNKKVIHHYLPIKN